MQNIKLTIAYDGTDFHGWQIQPGLPTIQGTLTEALQRILPNEPEPVTLYGAGRTDAGVHAWGQVANFQIASQTTSQTASKLTPEEYARALNALLPPTIRIRRSEQAAPDFHARYSAQAKTYRYRISRTAAVSPFKWRYVLHHPYPLDFAAMAEAARQFEGEHDFATFAASTGDEADDNDRTTHRCILSSRMFKVPGTEDNAADSNDAAGLNLDRHSEESSTRNPSAHPVVHSFSASHEEEWIYEVRGKSFMRNMVRKMAGTLIEVGRNRLSPEDIPRLLALADRAQSGPTAQPHALCLHAVEY